MVGGPLPRRKECKNELPETATADDWSDVAYVAPGRVRRSPSYPRVGSSSSNIYAGPFGSHIYTGATDGNAYTCATDTYTCTNIHTVTTYDQPSPIARGISNNWHS